MQKFGFLAAAAMSQGVDAFRATPFSGEHANAQIIEGEGRSTHRATPVADKANKYGSIISQLNKEKYKSPETKLYEKIFGAEEETPQRSNRHFRLGAQQAIVTNQKEDLFTTAFYMGGKQQMSAIVDTATDLVAVEGASCTFCTFTGETYDIEGNLDNGKATLESNDVQENYGEAKLTGRMATDDFCFQLGKCVNLDFLYIDMSELHEDTSAIIGFSRADHKFLLAPGSVKRDQFDTNVLSALKDYGEETFFSTRFQRDFISWIDIGTPDF